jgi:hypothetical protein
MRTMTDAERRHKARVAELDAQLDREVEAERLLRWAQKATEVCGAWELNQLAKRCAMYMNGEMADRGDESGKYLLEFRLEEKGFPMDSVDLPKLLAELKAAKKVN